MKTKIKTRFGTAMINQDGYYEIASVKEGNQDRLLHRLIYEDYYGVKVPSDFHIHHKNNQKLDNCILNLEALHSSEHGRLHRTGKRLSKATRMKLSKHKNSLNIYRVCREKDKCCNQGFIYTYQYYNDKGVRKKIRSVDLDKLKEKVKAKGLEWIEFENN